MEEVNLKPGSVDNPIVLKNKHQNTKLTQKHLKNSKIYIHRPLLQKYTKNNNGEKGFSFDKAPDSFESFTNNVISNPNLKPIDIKVALGLFNILDQINAGEGVVFICSTNELVYQYYGEDNLEVHFTNMHTADIELTPLHELISKKLNSKISNDSLNKVLIRLDSFHYINVTPITYQNSELGINDKSLKKGKAYLKFIEINDMMNSKCLEKIWI